MRGPDCSLATLQMQQTSTVDAKRETDRHVHTLELEKQNLASEKRMLEDILDRARTEHRWVVLKQR